MEKDQNINVEKQDNEEKIPETEQNSSLQKEEIKEITPEEELVKLKTVKNILIKKREKGKGRPTKKERRNIDKFREQY